MPPASAPTWSASPHEHADYFQLGDAVFEVIPVRHIFWDNPMALARI